MMTVPFVFVNNSLKRKKYKIRILFDKDLPSLKEFITIDEAKKEFVRYVSSAMFVAPTIIKIDLIKENTKEYHTICSWSKECKQPQ